MKPRTFAVAAGVDPGVFRTWHKGEYNPSPRPKTTEALKKIEGYCGLEEGTLTSLIRTHQVSAGPDDRPRTAFARRQMTAFYEKYKLYDFPPRLKAEWDEFYALMTPALEPDGPLRRNGHWFVDPETGNCPTAGKNMNTLAGFFGYLTLPTEGRSFLIPEKKKGKKKKKEGEGEKPPPKYTVVKGEGFSQDSLTLALVTDVPLVKRYLEFVKRRAGGVYNTETEHIINLCCMLLREETGFVRQHVDYCARLQTPAQIGEWNGICADAHERLRSQLRLLKKNGQIVQSRDVDEPIDFILNDPHPLRYLYKLAALMEADMPTPSATGVDRAITYRDMFLVRFLTANPLRISHFSEMTWRADNTGNLYQERDGSWWLRFPKDAFKNRTTLKKDRFTKNYRAPLPRSLYGYVQEYLSTHRSLLLGAEECDYVFRPSPRGGVAKHKSGVAKPMLAGSLSSILHKKARLYLRCAGFGAHAYRHIIATDYLLNHPSGIMVAASILHDTPEMVLKHYGHLQKSDFFRYWVAYHEKQFEAARREATGQAVTGGEEVREVA
jgi:integrase